MDLAVRYSNLVDTKTRNSLVFKDGIIFNTRYEGDPKAGAVKVRKSGSASVRDYNKASGIAPVAATSQFITITINKDKAFNEVVDGYEAAAVPDGIIADRLDECGYAMALTLDSDGADALIANGTTLSSTTQLTKSTIYSAIVDANTELTKAGVPLDGQRYIVVSPDAFALIQKSDEFTPASTLGDSVKETGAVGAISGMKVFVSNNMADVTANSHTYGIEFIAGHPAYATRVNEWQVPIRVVDGGENYIGASLVQGRKVYAHAVTNPNCILIKRYQKA